MARTRLGLVASAALLGAWAMAGGCSSSSHPAGGGGDDTGGKDATTADVTGVDAPGTDSPATETGPVEAAAEAGDAPIEAEAGCGNATTQLWSGGAAGDLTIAQGQVYFVGGGSVYAVPKGGGTATTLAQTAGAQRIAADVLSASSTNVYFSAGSAVMRVPSDGSSAPVAVSTGTAAAGALYVDDTNVYWIEASSPPQILLASKAATGVAPTVLVTNAGSGAASPDGGNLALQASTLYWLDAEASPNGQVLGVDLRGGAPAIPDVYASGGSGGVSMMIWGTELYWTDDAGGYSIPVAGPPLGDAGIIVLDAGDDASTLETATTVPGLTNQFWIDASSVEVLTTTGTVLRSPVGVGSYTEIYCGTTAATHGHITADAVGVYFTTDAGVFRTAP